MPSDLQTRPAPEVPRLLLTRREAAEALGVSQRFLWDLTAPRGPLPAIRLPGRGVSRSLRYDVRDLLAWIDSRKCDGKVEP
jgi:hypothetical protein